MRKLRKKIIFCNKEINRNLEFNKKIYFSLKDSFFNLNNFELKFDSLSKQRKRLSDKSTFIDNEASKFISRHSIDNKVDKSKSINIVS